MPMEKVMCLKDRCKRCDIGYLVKDYLLPIMQAMTVQITDYNMRMIDTKCLNTSVMFFNLFFGKQASKYTKYCDVQNVIRRRTNQIDDSTAISKNLCDDILRKTKHKYVYYIMLTDGNFVKPDGTQRFFPGHVFIIEKVPWGDSMDYYMYQSYINQYNYVEYVDRQKTTKLSGQKIKYYMEKIQDMVKRRVWDASFVAFWKDMTQVDTSHMLESVADNAFFPCYRKVRHDSCVKNLEKFVKNTLATIPDDRPDELYGSPDMFDDNAKPLTNKQMRKQMGKLNSILQKNS